MELGDTHGTAVPANSITTGQSPSATQLLGNKKLIGSRVEIPGNSGFHRSCSIDNDHAAPGWPLFSIIVTPVQCNNEGPCWPIIFARRPLPSGVSILATRSTSELLRGHSRHEWAFLWGEKSPSGATRCRSCGTCHTSATQAIVSQDPVLVRGSPGKPCCLRGLRGRAAVPFGARNWPGRLVSTHPGIIRWRDGIVACAASDRQCCVATEPAAWGPRQLGD
jgi:hypothetical protein